tara:strand:- start:110 stop:364 length:255 start_codon:yes stop_codon:yes gene_type:complete
MSWMWGEKKAEDKVKLDFTAKNRRRDLIKRTVKIHLELQMEYPQKLDIIQGIRDTKTSFDLPMGIDLKDAHISHIEVLGDPDAK